MAEEAKLKKLSQEDLDIISDFFADVINDKINDSVKSPKEIINMDISINVSYSDEDEELLVDFTNFEIEVDQLSKLTDEKIDEIIEESYCELDDFIDEHFRE